jgi:hypothetical protein
MERGLQKNDRTQGNIAQGAEEARHSEDLEKEKRVRRA